MVFTIRSSALSGILGISVRVETDIASGFPAFQIVGLGDVAVQESRERVRSAIRNSGFSFPAKRITVNLAPADVRKTGPAFDLAIALAIIAEECGLSERAFKNMAVLGELALDGSLRGIGASVAHAVAVRESGWKKLLLPAIDAREVKKIPNLEVLWVHSLSHAVSVLKWESFPESPTIENSGIPSGFEFPDFREILWQESAKRGLEIAAAGGHNILLEGVPGSGKTLLCRAFPGILPPPDFEELLEIARIRSVGEKFRDQNPFVPVRPFRAAHPSSSIASLIGGGPLARPGEISLAHLGTLFLDELREFPLRSLESLRQPMEDGEIRLSRVSAHVTYPAKFQLLATANPCPCGYLGDQEKNCSCSPGAIERYRSRLSGPILDRIDLFISVPRLRSEEFTKRTSPETSATVLARVLSARQRQQARFGKARTNSTITNREIDRMCGLDTPTERFLLSSVDRLKLSSRAYFRIKKVARTIADLSGSDTVGIEHVTEAIGFRERQERT